MLALQAKMRIAAKERQGVLVRFRRWMIRKTPYVIVFHLLVALVVLFFWKRIFVMIHPGEGGVLFHFFTGTEIDYTYPEGFHLVNPFNTMYRYNVRKQVVFHKFSVLSSQGLHIHVSLAMRFRPQYELLGLLHQQIGPNYVKTVIIPQTESVMRKQLGNSTAEQIYTNKEGLLTKAILLALEEVGRNFVEVEDIIIRGISLPKKLTRAIEDKLAQEQLLKSYEYRVQTASQEAQRKRLEAEGVRDYQAIVNQSLTDRLLKHQGIEATRKLARSANSKVVVIGAGKEGLPIILGTQ
jgi:prohibitin 1